MYLNKKTIIKWLFITLLLFPILAIAATKPVQPQKFSSSAEFVRAVYPHAKEVASQIGVDPKLLVAQAAHETNWGKKIPRHQDGSSSYNLFGIKSSHSNPNKKVVVQTKEYRRGKLVKEKAGFRTYNNFKESFADYAAMLKRSQRYQSALTKAHSPYDFLMDLQKSGYATDPSYAKKIYAVYQSSIIKKLA